MTDHRWGVYEKALPAGPWPALLEAAARAGYDFVEISIDESDERVARLDWPAGPRRELRRALADAPVRIGSMCLSTHRKYALGSLSAELRQRALDLMRRAIEFADEMGIRVVQVAGYDVHYEPSSDRTRVLYRESIVQAAEWARQACVMLAVENVESPMVDSVQKALQLVRAADTPWFQVYPDVGNLTAMEKDVAEEIRLGADHIVAVHLKDTRIREFRRVLETAEGRRWPMYLRSVKQLLRQAEPALDERAYGFPGLVDLLRAAQKEGIIRMERDRQGAIRVFPAMPAAPVPPVAVPVAAAPPEDVPVASQPDAADRPPAGAYEELPGDNIGNVAGDAAPRVRGRRAGGPASPGRPARVRRPRRPS